MLTRSNRRAAVCSSRVGNCPGKGFAKRHLPSLSLFFFGLRKDAASAYIPCYFRGMCAAHTALYSLPREKRGRERDTAFICFESCKADAVAPVAQWIARYPPKVAVASSSLAWGLPTSVVYFFLLLHCPVGVFFLECVCCDGRRRKGRRSEDPFYARDSPPRAPTHSTGGPL